MILVALKVTQPWHSRYLRASNNGHHCCDRDRGRDRDRDRIERIERVDRDRDRQVAEARPSLNVHFPL
jgi:hypothetical protein